MKFKNLILVASLLISSFVFSDTYICRTKYYQNNSTSYVVGSDTWNNIDEIQAQELACSYVPVNYNISTRTFTLVIFPSESGWYSNTVSGVSHSPTSNPRWRYYQSFFMSLSSFCQRNNISAENLSLWPNMYTRSGVVYFGYLRPKVFVENCFNIFSYAQSLEIISNMAQIISKLDDTLAGVSDIVPALESHSSNVSNLAQTVVSAVGVSTNLQHDIYNEVYGINYVLNSGGSGLSAINDKLSLLDPSLASSYVLCGAFADVMGMSGYPHQALISAGLATDFQDADNKISDQNWAHTVLAPVFNSQKRKNAYIQQFQKDGLTPPPGKTWDQLSENELENIANYSYNTPVSSNATLNAYALDYLKHIKDSNASIDASVDDIRQHIQGGPLEVNVMNWPDDIFGAANISNMFNDLISNFEASLTNFNPHYTWEDALFFDRSQYSWRGLNTLDFDPRHDPNSSPIGVSTFNFTPSGNYFQDVPNFLALQSRISVDIANMIATVTAYSQTNLADRASTADLEQQYQEEFLQQSAEALNEFEQAQSYSNLFARNARFIDTSSVFSTPSGFTEIFSGNHSIPTHINLQLPSWHFGQDDQSTPDVGSTITIETAQYATFFQNCRYVFLFLYWGITVMIMIWLFRLFTRFISWIPLSLTGGGSHDTVSI